MSSKFVDPFAPASRRGAAPVQPPTPQPPAGEVRNPERMTKAELVAWAKELGVATDGTKTELVARIRGKV